MSINIWLDDERDPAAHDCAGFQWFTTGEALIEALEGRDLAEIEAISLDHDLGAGRMTGYDVITWIEQHVANGGHAPTRIYIHTQNSVGTRSCIGILRGFLSTRSLPARKAWSTCYWSSCTPP